MHFGLYSRIGKGEWYLNWNRSSNVEKYEKQADKFRVNNEWARDLIKTAKAVGCKYITLTTRHHDGFSLYDTCGLSDYDALHSACGRDLVKEFAQACNEGGIVPFFYHTLLDWHNPDYSSNFSAYIDYLVKSIEILCRNYGKIGGFWFDGMWDKPDADWREDELYGTIRRYQPEAMIINNTGLSACGKVGHREIDSVTFERGKPCFVDNTDKHRAGEMCQILNDHWGYAKEDCNYKSVKELIEDLVDCRKYGCNYLLNTGLRGNGAVNPTDNSLLKEIGKWVNKNEEFIRTARPSVLKAKNAEILSGKNCYYAVIKDIGVSGDPNVSFEAMRKTINTSLKIERAEWLDNGEEIPVRDGCFELKPFAYGICRVRPAWRIRIPSGISAVLGNAVRFRAFHNVLFLWNLRDRASHYSYGYGIFESVTMGYSAPFRLRGVSKVCGGLFRVVIQQG